MAGSQPTNQPTGEVRDFPTGRLLTVLPFSCPAGQLFCPNGTTWQDNLTGKKVQRARRSALNPSFMAVSWPRRWTARGLTKAENLHSVECTCVHPTPLSKCTTSGALAFSAVTFSVCVCEVCKCCCADQRMCAGNKCTVHWPRGRGQRGCHPP